LHPGCPCVVNVARSYCRAFDEEENCIKTKERFGIFCGQEARWNLPLDLGCQFVKICHRIMLCAMSAK